MANTVIGESINGNAPDGIRIPPGKNIIFDGGPTFGATSFVATWFMPSIWPWTPAIAAGGLGLTANTVGVVRYFLPFQISVTRIVAEVTSPVGGQFFGISIYNAAGTTKLVDSGAISAAAGAVVSATIAAAAAGPGDVLIAFNASNAGISFRVFAVQSTIGAIVNNGTGNVFTAANAAVAGVNPATLGVLTPSLAWNLPICKFQA